MQQSGPTALMDSAPHSTQEMHVITSLYQVGLSPVTEVDAEVDVPSLLFQRMGNA